MLVALGAAVATAPAVATPNIVLVQTDDQPLSSISSASMPKVQRHLTGAGTRFKSYYVSTPLCCPSRSALITGQYGHNNGVLRNRYPDLRDKDNVLPVWLQRAGYRTIHLGKFMNHYPIDKGPAPGWDRWASLAVNRYYGYELGVGSKLVGFGDKPSDHLGRVVTERATGAIRRFSDRPAPFYLQADYPAPHQAAADPQGACDRAAIPDARDEGRFGGAALPMPPSFDEEDVSDKPGFVADHDRLSAAQIANLTREHRCMLASLRSVDRGVGRIVSALKHEHELDDTVILFTSDNGFYRGEHRIPNGKHFPYEEGVHVPLIVRGTKGMRRQAPDTIASPAANIDLAPTILDLANAESCAGPSRCRTMDGLSLVPQLRGGPAPAQPRDLLLELDDPNPLGRNKPCTYEAVHTSTQVYVEHSMAEVDSECQPVDETEFYDLGSDPFQLGNLFPAPPASPREAQQSALAARLAELRNCAGVQGRDQQIAGRPFCAVR